MTSHVPEPVVPVVPLIVLGEAEEIQEARKMLRRAEDRIALATYQHDGDSEFIRGRARLAHALQVANQALFSVLSTASVYADCDASARVLREALDKPDDGAVKP